jgi:beta-glucosidase
VHLNAGASQQVSIPLTPRQFTVVDADGRRMFEPGQWTLSIGGEQPDEAALRDGRVLQTRVTAVGTRTELE